MADYLTGDYYTDRHREVRREWTAEEHRRRARQLLCEARSGSHEAAMRDLAAAQVHATLATSLAGHARPHTHGPVR